MANLRKRGPEPGLAQIPGGEIILGKIAAGKNKYENSANNLTPLFKDDETIKTPILSKINFVHKKITKTRENYESSLHLLVAQLTDGACGGDERQRGNSFGG